MAVIEEKMEEQPAAPLRPASLWRNRDFLLLWGGQIVSSVGTQVSQLALPLLILALTHSPAQAGLLAGIRGLPYLLLVLPAGALVDRWDPRRVMLICDSARAVALASVPVALALGHLPLTQLYVVSLLEGMLFVFFDQANSNCFVRVVSKEQLPAAVAQNQAIYGTSGMIGPAVGGLLFGLGRGVPFLMDAVSYALSVLSVFAIKTDVRPPVRAEDSAPNLAAEIAEGWRWLHNHAVMRFLAVLTGGMMLFSAGYSLILIVLAQRFHAGPAAIGLLLATGGPGIFAGSLLAVRLQKRFRFGPLMIGTTWIWALTWIFYALAPNIIWLGVVNALSIVVVPVYMGTQFAWRLAQIPDALLGRVNSVFRLIAFGSMPLGLALVGFLLEWIGPIPTIIVTFAPQLLLSLAATFHPALRQAGNSITGEKHEHPSVS